MKTPALILVVDDQPINVRLLERKLSRSGLRVATAHSGAQALEIAAAQVPNLILLDIMMPVMDGLEVCRRLKAKPETKDIPVIFITARTTKEGKIEGLDTGAADYITKPIDLDETLARVQTQLRVQENHRENIDLQKRLGEARQHTAISHITEGIAHNLNNLLGVVVGYLDLLKSSLGNPEKVERCANQLDRATKRMVGVVAELTTIAEFERARLSSYPMDELLETAIARFQLEHQLSAPVQVTSELAPGRALETNREIFEGVIGRLLINAWESYPASVPAEKKELSMAVQPVAQQGETVLELRVQDRGRGVPEDLADSVFEPFVSSAPAVGRGMGLTIVRHSLRTLGGSVRLAAREGGGTEAIVQHPLDRITEEA